MAAGLQPGFACRRGGCKSQMHRGWL